MTSELSQHWPLNGFEFEANISFLVAKLFTWPGVSPAVVISSQKMFLKMSGGNPPAQARCSLPASLTIEWVMEPRRDDAHALKRTAGRRVLVVDDNAAVAQSMCELIGLWGHDCHLTLNARSALDQAPRLLPHAILVDLGLPDMDGLQLTVALRQIPALEGIIIVAMTGDEIEGIRQEALLAGCDDLLEKPVDTRWLKNLLVHPRIAERP